jgi:hypothetical protein
MTPRRGDLTGADLALSQVLDDWLVRQHGILSSRSGHDDVRDGLAARGYRIVPTAQPHLPVPEPPISPGMVVDGDVLRDVVMDATPRVLSDQAARDLADAVLAGAARAGMTLLHGPDAQPGEVVHQCPTGDADMAPCCGRSVIDGDLLADAPELVTCPHRQPSTAPQPTVPDEGYLDELHRALARRIGNLRKGSRKLLEISSARNADHVALLDERDRLRDDLVEARRIGADVARQRAELLRRIERSARAVPDGEDVPARLAAVAEIVAAEVSGAAAGDLRHAANVLRGAPPEVLAAVAAALTRPTEVHGG